MTLEVLVLRVAKFAFQIEEVVPVVAQGP